MRLLLDTHIVLALLQQGDAPLSPGILGLLRDPASSPRGSAATLWEIAIKSSLGKLQVDGMFRTDDPEGFAMAVHGLLDVAVDLSDPGEIRLGKPAN